MYLTEAGTLAQEYELNYLELVQPDGNIVSSAQWPAHFGYKEPAIANVGQPFFLKEEVLGQDPVGDRPFCGAGRARRGFRARYCGWRAAGQRVSFEPVHAGGQHALSLSQLDP